MVIEDSLGKVFAIHALAPSIHAIKGHWLRSVKTHEIGINQEENKLVVTVQKIMKDYTNQFFQKITEMILKQHRVIDDTTGKSVLPIDAFAPYIHAIIENLLRMVKTHGIGLKHDDIQCFLIGPARWIDTVKQFLQKTAEMILKKYVVIEDITGKSVLSRIIQEEIQWVLPVPAILINTGKRFMLKTAEMILKKYVVIEDITGKSVLSIDGFAPSIHAIREYLLRMVKTHGIRIKQEEIQWVLTVPAIWTDTAKQLMQKNAPEMILKKDVVIEDITGKSVLSFDAFVHAIREHLLRMVKTHGIRIRQEEIQWVLTVPAIWTDTAKQLMHKNAAGLILKKDMVIEDITGKSVLAIDALDPSIHAIEGRLWRMANTINQEEIKWVVFRYNIWTEIAKQFIQKKAEMILKKDMVIEDIIGKSVFPTESFARSIHAIKGHWLRMLKTHGIRISQVEIQWVVTVPEIWTDISNQFTQKNAGMILKKDMVIEDITGKSVFDIDEFASSIHAMKGHWLRIGKTHGIGINQEKIQWGGTLRIIWTDMITNQFMQKNAEMGGKVGLKQYILLESEVPSIYCRQHILIDKPRGPSSYGAIVVELLKYSIDDLGDVGFLYPSTKKRTKDEMPKSKEKIDDDYQCPQKKELQQKDQMVVADGRITSEKSTLWNGNFLIVQIDNKLKMKVGKTLSGKDCFEHEQLDKRQPNAMRIKRRG